MTHTSKNAESRIVPGIGWKKLVVTAIADDDKSDWTVQCILLDYDGSNSFPSIVKGIIETA
jgi:hypothetical protein